MTASPRTVENTRTGALTVTGATGPFVYELLLYNEIPQSLALAASSFATAGVIFFISVAPKLLHLFQRGGDE